MPNVYDVLHRPPRPQRKLKSREEKLARAIVASGRLRLDADNESNFTRLLIPADRLNMTFTLRELSEPKLLAASLARITAGLTPLHGPEEARRRAAPYLEKAKNDIKRRSPVATKTELMVARAIVSCNAFSVIQLLHLEGAEIYVSFGHTVSDVLDISTWQEVGENNGLQYFGRGQNAVYVSCGGHPFLSKEERTYTTDGFPALARLLVVAAQETGHNADMVRGENGQWLGRHSAQDWGRAPNAKTGPGRKADLARTQACERTARSMGLNLIAEWERHLEFYRHNKLRNTRSLFAWLKSRLGWLLFTVLLRTQGLGRLCRLSRSKSPATQLRRCLADMVFNLAPSSDAYKRADPQAEEAMMCMEALARVPQQVVKWGHPATSLCMATLYRQYYGEVVPACAKATLRYSSKKS